MRVRNGRAEIAIAHAVLERHEPLRVFPVDVGRAGFQLHVAEIAQRDVGGRGLGVGVRQRDRNRPDGVDVAAVFRRQPDREGEVHLAFVDARDLLAADRGLHDGVDVADREAVARGLRAVDPDDQIGLTEQLNAAGSVTPGTWPISVFNCFGKPLQLDQISGRKS